MDGPDPECVRGYGEQLLAGDRSKPTANKDHSRGVPLQLMTRPPSRDCDENPLAGFVATTATGCSSSACATC